MKHENDLNGDGLPEIVTCNGAQSLSVFTNTTGPVQPKSESEPEPKSKPEPEPESKPKSKSEPEPEPESKPES